MRKEYVLFFLLLSVISAEIMATLLHFVFPREGWGGGGRWDSRAWTLREGRSQGHLSGEKKSSPGPGGKVEEGQGWPGRA